MFEKDNTLIIIPIINGSIKLKSLNLLKKFKIFSYTPNINATVAPDIPGNNSDKPINNPAIKYFIFSFTNHYHQLRYLKALEQKQLHHVIPL